MNTINRRRFLSTSIAAVASSPLLIRHSWAKEAIGKVIPIEASQMDENDYNPSLDALWKTFMEKDEACLARSTFTDEEKNAFRYPRYEHHYVCLATGYELIKPRFHDEYVFVSSCISPIEHCLDRLEEYVRRRNGEEPQMPDHPLFHLQASKGTLPNTYGILAYYEQVDAVVGQLVNIPAHGVVQLRRMLRRSFDEGVIAVKASLRPEYREQMSDKDVEHVCRAIHAHLLHAKYYSYHSTMVAAAERRHAAKIPSGGSRRSQS
ncbi:MAG: hypothetical protein AB2L22_09765 [Syntrophales bacterium]